MAKKTEIFINVQSKSGTAIETEIQLNQGLTSKPSLGAQDFESRHIVEAKQQVYL